MIQIYSYSVVIYDGIGFYNISHLSGPGFDSRVIKCHAFSLSPLRLIEDGRKEPDIIKWLVLVFSECTLFKEKAIHATPSITNETKTRRVSIRKIGRR